MKRVLVIGCCGAGKSTLARTLHRKLGWELIHLDQHYWRPGWVEPSPAVWTGQVRELIQRDAWVMDGNYGGTIGMRLQRADTVILLDYSTSRCLFRVIKRTAQYWRKTRPDMAPGCRERLDLGFLHFVYTFRRKKLPQILERLEVLPASVRVIRLSDPAATRRFLRSLEELAG
jgi:adenylate kinase family enzyme